MVAERRPAWSLPVGEAGLSCVYVLSSRLCVGGWEGDGLSAPRNVHFCNLSDLPKSGMVGDGMK